MRCAWILITMACSGTRAPQKVPPPPPTTAVDPLPPPTATAPPPDAGAPPAPTTSSDVSDFFPPPPVTLTTETKCDKDTDCVITHGCCGDALTNKAHAPKKEDCTGVACPAMVQPPISDRACCNHACTPLFKKGQTCP